MYINKQTFLDEVKKIYPTICGQNSWAKKYFELEMPNNCIAVHADVSAERCWGLYCASRDNALQFLLLGEVSMRSKIALVQNFGLTSASGHEDDEPWLSPWLGSDTGPLSTSQAKAMATVDPATLDAKKNVHLKPLQGPGSILSDRLWTPLMNDAWLLGGVQTQQSFHLVTEGLGEQKLVAAMNQLAGQASFEQTRAKFGASPAVGAHAPKMPKLIQDAWRQWFVDNPNYLYESWGPRVLARELIGLMTFGYKPEFTRYELGFRCEDVAQANNSTISAYSEALNNLQFHQGSDPVAKNTVLKALSTWLFGKDDVLK
jgi:hypothetical protein